MPAAILFVQAFLEAAAFHVLLLTEEKRVIHRNTRMPRQSLLAELPRLLGIPNVHFFIRPLMANVLILDLDGYLRDAWIYTHYIHIPLDNVKSS